MLYLSVALVVVSLVAWDAFRRWLKAQDFARGYKLSLEQVLKQLHAIESNDSGHRAHADQHRAELDNVVRLLAIDFKKAIDALAKDMQTTREHVDTRLGGALAQTLPTGRGLNR